MQVGRIGVSFIKRQYEALCGGKKKKARSISPLGEQPERLILWNKYKLNMCQEPDGFLFPIEAGLRQKREP